MSPHVPVAVPGARVDLLVPSEIRRSFIVAGVSTFVAWSVAGLFLSLIPSFVVVVLGRHNLAVAASVLALMLGVSAAA